VDNRYALASLEEVRQSESVLLRLQLGSSCCFVDFAFCTLDNRREFQGDHYAEETKLETRWESTPAKEQQEAVFG
jgi:hypothetical protein